MRGAGMVLAQGRAGRRPRLWDTGRCYTRLVQTLNRGYEGYPRSVKTHASVRQSGHHLSPCSGGRLIEPCVSITLGVPFALLFLVVPCLRDGCPILAYACSPGRDVLTHRRVGA